MPDKLIVLMYQSWADLDRATEGLTPEEAIVRLDHASSVAWSVGHVTAMVDSWINVSFQGLFPNSLVADPMFRTGGSGEAKDWAGIRAAVTEVREAASRWLDPLAPADLDRRIPYNGSIEFLRARGLVLDYALMRIAAHHFMHAGEILTVRSRLGHVIPEVPDWCPALA